MSTHTPGPWHVDEQPNDLVRIIGAVDGDTYDDGSPRMIYTHVCDVIDNADEQANARLIAKAPIAPKLAEALRSLLDIMDCDSEQGWASEQRAKARTALTEWDAP